MFGIDHDHIIVCHKSYKKWDNTYLHSCTHTYIFVWLITVLFSLTCVHTGVDTHPAPALHSATWLYEEFGRAAVKNWVRINCLCLWDRERESGVFINCYWGEVSYAWTGLALYIAFSFFDFESLESGIHYLFFLTILGRDCSTVYQN